MADFCKQSSIELFGKDFGDLKGLCGTADSVVVLCEECGKSSVDSDGRCLGGDMCNHVPPVQD